MEEIADAEARRSVLGDLGRVQTMGGHLEGHLAREASWGHAVES